MKWKTFLKGYTLHTPFLYNICSNFCISVIAYVNKKILLSIYKQAKFI